MPRLLPLEDFRARRTALTRGDFLIAAPSAAPANDRIDRATWNSVVTLPDDIAVRTTNYHGTAIRQLHDLWGAWIECCGGNHDCLFASVFRSRIREIRFPDTLKLFPVLFYFSWIAVARKSSGFCGLSEQLGIRSRRKSCDFPVNFPVCREYLSESGSLQTASTAIYFTISSLRPE